MANKNAKQNIAAATTASSLTEIRRKLRTGEIAKLADSLSYSPSHVANVLMGRRNNAGIVKAAQKLTARRR